MTEASHPTWWRRRKPVAAGLLAAAIAVAAAVLTAVSNGEEPDSLPRWLAVNETSYSLYVEGNSIGDLRLRPDERRVFASTFDARAEDGPVSYVFKAYRFEPGPGSLRGYDPQGKTTRGTRGLLIYCESFTWEELHAAGLVLRVIQNVASGERMDGLPCPNL